MNVQKKLAIGIIRTKLNLLGWVHIRKAGEAAFRIFCTPLKRPYKNSMVFTNAEPLQFILNGNCIKGYRVNPSPEKVLLLHGFSSCCHKFDHFVAPLVNKNLEVLAFDAPAHGASGGKTVNAIQYSEMIKEVIKLYGPVNRFIAHSFGGIALILAMEDLNIAPAKIVLIAPATE
ncbi:MAG TPA: alpha/beta fold hydrolase, partial [Ferruginibacter sp.]|nr:alpha/beta fold hydrolase [Ferruginibacter sp.]